MVDLSFRQQNIMGIIVSDYLVNGEPLGSKIIMEGLGNTCSSATIRNEMAEMERIGLLRQPHTSAGRIPTAMGVRYYIDHLMRIPPLAQRQKQAMKDMVVPYGPDPGAILHKGAAALTTLTGCASLIVFPSMGMARIERIDLFYVRRGIWGVAMTTSGGGIHSALCHMNVSRDDGQMIGARLSRILKGVMLKDITSQYMKGIMIHLGVYAFHCFGLLDTILQFAVSLRDSKVCVDGQSALVRGFDSEKIEVLLRFFQQQNGMLSVFSPPRQLSVLLGEETPYRQLHNMGAVYTRFMQGGELEGTIGVIGPMQMNYSGAAAHVSYMSQLLETLLATDRY